MYRLRIANHVAFELVDIEREIRTNKLARIYKPSSKYDTLGSVRQRVQNAEISSTKGGFP